MNKRERIKQLLGESSYRTRLGYFLVLGVSVTLAALLVKDDFWEGVLVDFAVTFMAVGFVSLLWDFLGGDPTELRMTQSFGEVEKGLVGIQKSMAVLTDIVDQNIGVVRIWPIRRVWERDPVDGLAVWKERVCQATQVDIVSNTLWTSWFRDETFRENFFRSLAEGTSARILIYDPDANVLTQRANDEGDSRRKEVWEMESEIYSTLNRIARGWLDMRPEDRAHLQVRLTTHFYHLAQIIRADDLAVVAIYLSGKTGSPSPTLQLRGPDTEYFKTYMEQIEILWGRAREVSEAEFKRLAGHNSGNQD